MAKVRRQARHDGLDVDTRPVPAENGAHCEAVAQVMEARSAASCATLEASPPRHASEHPPDVGGDKPGAGGRDEEARRLRDGKEFVTLAGVTPEHTDGARVDRDLAGLTEFAVNNGQHFMVKVDVVTVESARLASARRLNTSQAPRE